MNLNPFGMSGWPLPPNGAPPTLGALPATHQPNQSVQKFEFSFPILNGTVTGPGRRNYFNIQTTNSAIPMTTISNHQGTVAIIHWYERPQFEAARCGIALQRAAQFIALSPDRSYRTMIWKNKQYYWIPDRDGTYLCDGLPYQSHRQQFAKTKLIETGGVKTVILEISNEAFPAGLFEPCIISTLFLWAGIVID